MILPCDIFSGSEMTHDLNFYFVFDLFLVICSEVFCFTFLTFYLLFLGAMYELLVAKPEQEQKLLTAISNKLGDPNRKVASRASYLLGQLGMFVTV